MFTSAIAYSKPFWRADEMKRGGFICLFTMLICMFLCCVVPNTKQAVVMMVGSKLDNASLKSVPNEFIEIYKTEMEDFKNNFVKNKVD